MNEFWGPPTWIIIHFFAYHFNPQYASAYKILIYLFQDLLSCPKCREHIRENLKKVPLEPALKNRETLFRWSYDLHSLVNEQLGKENISFEDAKKRYAKASYGPALWRCIHSFAATYAPIYSASYKIFIYIFTDLLPTEQERDNLKYTLQKVPQINAYMKTNDDLFRWTFLLHDNYNRQLGKSSPQFETVKKEYWKNLDIQACKQCTAQI